MLRKFRRINCTIWLQFQCILTFNLAYLDGKIEGSSTMVADTVQCYSCMSADIKKSWGRLDDFYYAPLNFTDDCNHPFKERGIKTVVCSSACVTIIEVVYTSGVPTGHNYFRGCLHRITKHGLNNSTLRQYGFEIFDLCDKVPRSSLFRNKYFAIDDHVMVCTCWGDKCNGARPNGANRTFWTININSLTLSLFLYFIFNWTIGFEKLTFTIIILIIRFFITFIGCAFQRYNSLYLL